MTHLQALAQAERWRHACREVYHRLSAYPCLHLHAFPGAEGRGIQAIDAEELAKKKAKKKANKGDDEEEEEEDDDDDEGGTSDEEE